MILFKVVKVFFIFWLTMVFAFIYTILRPLKYIRRKELQGKIHDLTEQAVASLKCGAITTNIILPNSGITLHVVEAGGDKKANKELVILLHGFPDSWYGWKEVIAPIAKAGHHVVVPDLRGYNLSEKPEGVSSYKVRDLAEDVTGIIQFYKKEKVHLVAHDWGGIVAWEFARRHPELLEKLIIINSPHPAAYQREIRRSINQLLSSWYILAFQIPVLPYNLLTFDPEKFAKSVFTTPKYTPSQFEIELRGSGIAQNYAGHAMINYYRAIFRANIEALTKGRRAESGEKKNITTPTLIIWGEDDVALVRELAECSRWVPNSKVHCILNEKNTQLCFDCTHWVMEDAPEEATQQILEFIK